MTVNLSAILKSCLVEISQCNMTLCNGGNLTFAPATIAPVMISPTTESCSEDNDWVFGSG